VRRDRYVFDLHDEDICLLKFCSICGSYAPAGQTRCRRCGARSPLVEADGFPELNPYTSLERESLRLGHSSSGIRKPPSELTVNDVLNNFPASSFRPYQKEIITGIVDSFQAGKRCVILAAPTGFGKSYVNAAFCSVTHSFYATPQLVLIDQIMNDPLLSSRFAEIKGRQNYHCHYHPDRTVNIGRCVTEGYKCPERLKVCPYWIQKTRAQNAQSVLLSFAYLMLEGQTDRAFPTHLGTRDLLVLDEAHNIEEQCLNQISVRVNPFTIPWEVYNQLLPQIRKVKTETQLKELLQRLEEQLRRVLEQDRRIVETTGLSVVQAEDREKIERYLDNYGLYKSSRSEWVWQIHDDQMTIQPVYGRQFMKELVWKRANYYIVSSATILDPKEYAELTGLSSILNEDEICFLQAPSTFPVQNRPIIDMTVGPLSKVEWSNNAQKALQRIEEILRKEKGSVAIHCHSYDHQQWLAQSISDDLKTRLIVHTSRDRQKKLEEWKHSQGKVFASVAFNEGQDWKYDLCSAQILLKVSYPDLGDERVKRRLDLGQHKWYNNKAMLEVIQAYGRAIRAEDDKARFYIVDGSFTGLVRRCWQFMPAWFKEALPASFTSFEKNTVFSKIPTSKTSNVRACPDIS